MRTDEDNYPYRVVYDASPTMVKEVSKHRYASPAIQRCRKERRNGKPGARVLKWGRQIDEDTGLPPSEEK